MPSSSRATRSSRGQGKPLLASLAQGSSVAALSTSSRGYGSPRIFLASSKRLRSDVFLRGEFLHSNSFRFARCPFTCSRTQTHCHLDL